MASDTPVPDTLTILTLNAMITHVPVNNERGTNLTNLTSLKVENAKGGLGPGPFTHENKENNNKLVHLHITNVLLDANNKNYDRHLFGHALKQHAYTLTGLLELIRTPSKIIELRWKDKDDGNKEKMFAEEVYEDLLALYPFFCMLQNGHGPIADGLFDIFATTRSQFEDFITEGGFKIYAPVLYDEDAALISQQQHRNSDGLGQDGNRTTTSVCDINLWASQFNPITGDIAMWTQCAEELYYDEINWPPVLYWDGYIDYINRVLSQDFSTVYKNNNPPEHSLDTIATTENRKSQTESVTGDDNTTSSNVKDNGEDNINGGLKGTNGGEGGGGGISTAREDIVINPATNRINYYGEAINVVDGKGEEVNLFGGGRSDPDISSGDDCLEGSAIKIQRLFRTHHPQQAAATKIQCSFRRYRLRECIPRMLDAAKCKHKNDSDLEIIHKAKKRDEKSIRRNIARHNTGSGKLYHKAVRKIQPSVVVIQSHARMFIARRKVISMRGGVYRRIRANGIKRESATSPVRSYTMSGTRRIHSQASELFQSSSLVTLLEKNDGYNGEMGDAWNVVDPSISFSANVFAIHMSNQGPLPSSKALWTWGEESSSTLCVRLEGEYVEKVVVDRGAWGEYDDNPIDVRDLKRIMIDLWKFTGQVSTVYNMYTLVSITLVYIVIVGGMTFDVFNPKTGVVLYRLDVRMISDELRVSLQPKVDYHDNNDDSLPDHRWMVEMAGTSTKTHDPQVTPSHFYQWGESTNLICFAMSNNSLIKTPQAVSDILLSPYSGSKCAGIICILLHQWKGQPIRCIKKVLELHRHKEDVIWGACEHDDRPQLPVEDTTGTRTYDMDNPDPVSVSNGWHHVALINDDKIGESRMMGASFNGSSRDVSNNMSTFTFEDPLNRNDTDEDQGNIGSSDEYILDVSINTHDISHSTHLASTTDNNMDTAGFTMPHGLNHGIVHTHGQYNDTTTRHLGYYKELNQYDRTRIRVTIYSGSKDQGPMILIQVLHSRLVRPRMTGE